MEIDFFARAVELEGELVSALAQAATYRHMLLITLEAWEEDRKRLNGAQERLRQLAGSESWHHENDG